MNIERLGFIAAVYVCGTQEKTVTCKEGKFSFEVSQLLPGVILHDTDSGRAQRRSLFPSVFVPWSNIAYVVAMKEPEAKPAPRAKKVKTEE